MAEREKILVALSGGVDSSVAALLLQQAGHAVSCAYMKNWINEENIIGECPWEEDIADARAVCTHLGLEFEVVNLMQEYREKVVAYMLSGYKKGLTPNPDIMCNREIKFGVLRHWARDHGFGAIATGHYAQRVAGATGWELHEGADPNKDQSYFLALLGPEQLAAARFPLGRLHKPAVRALARAGGLPTAEKKDSQGICFIGQVKMADFLREFVEDAPGPIVSARSNRVLGEHLGLHYYTLGQRKGIGIPSNTDHKAYVVVGKRAADRALLVAFDEPQAPGLFQSEIAVANIQWIGGAAPATSPTQGRVRYRDPRVALGFWATGTDTAQIHFCQPQRGLAAGQILAFYDGTRLLGGGIYSGNGD